MENNDLTKRLQELGSSNYKIAPGLPDITGWKIVGQDGQGIGDVSKLLFDQRAGSVRYLVITLTAEFSKRVAIPIGFAKKDAENAAVLLLEITGEQLKLLPAYTSPADLNPEKEVLIRDILKGGSQSPYEHPQFYMHRHFNENRLFTTTDLTDEREEDIKARELRTSHIVAKLNHVETGTNKAANRLKQIHENFKQSIWLDFIDREIMRSGKLQKLISKDGIRGLTSNPAIFEKAISSSADYDSDIFELSNSMTDTEAIFYALAVKDIRQAADMLADVYNQEVRGADGYVSLEVSPLLAIDQEATINQARQLWQQVDRENVMIKIPATLPCLPAIQIAISEGININVTLIFGLQRYEDVAYAYIEGLEERLDAGEDISRIASVASFFLSRIDLIVDTELKAQGHDHLKGMVAIASAKAAYALYKRIFSGERWQKLADAGAKPQRLLWASTGNKDPEGRDTKYIEELIGPDTVNTAPLSTIDAFRDHGETNATLEKGVEQALYTLEELGQAGINLKAIAIQLEKEGIAKFKEPYQKLLAAINSKITHKRNIKNSIHTPMEISENELDVINDLIKINNDRVAGFEKSATDLEGDANGIVPILTKLAGESRQNVVELTDFVMQYGGEAVEGTSTSGDLHRAWIDIKATFTGSDLLAILNECERGEDAAKAAYRDAFDPDNGLSSELTLLLEAQQLGINDGHDLIKSLRDQVDTTEEAQNEPDDQAPGFPITNGSVDPATQGNANYLPDEASGNEYTKPAAFAPEPERNAQEEDWQDEQEGNSGNSKLLEFFVNELKDLLWAERELVDTLPDMAEAATSEELKTAFTNHLTETEEHVNRLEQIFAILGLEPDSRKCEAMAGIIDEGDEIISATEEGTAQRDVGLIFAGQKAEHYEIASYGGMVALAKTLGYYDIAETLVLTLDEEKTADATLTDIAENQANYAASTERADD